MHVIHAKGARVSEVYIYVLFITFGGGEGGGLKWCTFFKTINNVPFSGETFSVVDQNLLANQRALFGPMEF